MSSISHCVFVTCIGRRDPEPDAGEGEGAALAAFRAVRPQEAYLVGNRGPEIEERTELTAWEIVRLGLPAENVHTLVMDLDDPTDFTALYPALGEFFDRIRNQVREKHPDSEVEYVVSLSSGTQQIGQVVTLLLEEGRLPGARRVAVRAPSYVTPEKPRVYTIDVDFVRESYLVRGLPEWFDQYRFRLLREAMKELSGFAGTPGRRSRAGKWKHVFGILEAWDGFDHEKAYRLAAAFQEPGRFQEYLPEWLNTLDVIRKATSRGDVTAEYLLDLYHNADRRRREKRSATALMRLWHLWEGIVYFRVAKMGINPTNLKRSPDKREWNRLQEAIKNGEILDRLNNKTSLYRLDRRQATKLLETWFADRNQDWLDWLKTPVSLNYGGAKRQQPRCDWLEELRLARNNSLAGHGSKPVTEELTGLAYALLTGAMRTFVREDLEEYPLSADRLKVLGSELVTI